MNTEKKFIMMVMIIYNELEALKMITLFGYYSKPIKYD